MNFKLHLVYISLWLLHLSNGQSTIESEVTTPIKVTPETQALPLENESKVTTQIEGTTKQRVASKKIPLTNESEFTTPTQTTSEAPITSRNLHVENEAKITTSTKVRPEGPVISESAPLEKEAKITTSTKVRPEGPVISESAPLEKEANITNSTNAGLEGPVISESAPLENDQEPSNSDSKYFGHIQYDVYTEEDLESSQKLQAKKSQSDDNNISLGDPECNIDQHALTTTVSIRGDCGWNIANVAKDHHVMMLTINSLEIVRKREVTPDWNEPGCIKIIFVDKVVIDTSMGARTYTAENKVYREEMIACETRIPTEPYIYIVEAFVQGVIFKKTKAVSSFALTAKTASGYGKHALEACPEGYAVCRNDRRVCILNTQICNGVADCADGEDDKDCIRSETKR